MIPFTKAHACGNDFLIVEAEWVATANRQKAAVRLCARNTGVGADGVEYFEWSGKRSGRIQLFNADGSIAEISGNGTRCVAAWMARERGSGSGDVFAIETDAGVRECRIISANENLFEIATAMGVPEVSEAVVVLADRAVVPGVVVSMGNPHFVIFVKDESFSVAGSSWESVGREICFHPDFPRQANVEFVRVIGTDRIEFRIFERGVGPTTSSGTGSCASAAASIARRGVDKELTVVAPGGAQRVNWQAVAAEMILIGPADLIATGEAF